MTGGPPTGPALMTGGPPTGPAPMPGPSPDRALLPAGRAHL